MRFVGLEEGGGEDGEMIKSELLDFAVDSREIPVNIG